LEKLTELQPWGLLCCESLQVYSSEQSLKDAAGSSLIYTPGEEKALYASLRKAYEFLVEQAESEAYEEALKRKKRLDKQIILGKKYLAEDKIAEADLAFEDSLQYHKDEATLFTYIAKILIDANHEARALPYLKKAIGFDHTDQGARNMMQEILSKREQS